MHGSRGQAFAVTVIYPERDGVCNPVTHVWKSGVLFKRFGRGYKPRPASVANPVPLGAGYPAGVPKPTGSVNLISGAEQQANRAAANNANRAIHRADPSISPQQIHEVQPVKFGGSPTDPSNKVYLDRSTHQQVTNWWNDLQRYIERVNE